MTKLGNNMPAALLPRANQVASQMLSLATKDFKWAKKILESEHWLKQISHRDMLNVLACHRPLAQQLLLNTQTREYFRGSDLAILCCKHPVLFNIIFDSERLRSKLLQADIISLAKVSPAIAHCIVESKDLLARLDSRALAILGSHSLDMSDHLSDSMHSVLQKEHIWILCRKNLKLAMTYLQNESFTLLQRCQIAQFHPTLAVEIFHEKRGLNLTSRMLSLLGVHDEISLKILESEALRQKLCDQDLAKLALKNKVFSQNLLKYISIDQLSEKVLVSLVKHNPMLAMLSYNQCQKNPQSLTHDLLLQLAQADRAVAHEIFMVTKPNTKANRALICHVASSWPDIAKKVANNQTLLKHFKSDELALLSLSHFDLMLKVLEKTGFDSKLDNPVILMKLADTYLFWVNKTIDDPRLMALLEKEDQLALRMRKKAASAAVQALEPIGQLPQVQPIDFTIRRELTPLFHQHSHPKPSLGEADYTSRNNKKSTCNF